MSVSPFWMFGALLLSIMLGFPVAFSLMGTAFYFGYQAFGFAVFYQFASKVNMIASNFELIAVPLFVFMGALLERSGIAADLFRVVSYCSRRLPGGLALATLLISVILAASTGVIGATESIIGLLAVPAMMKQRYDKALISGVVCAGGSLATIIPPSIVAVVLAPLAEVSVGDLFVSMLLPGLMLSSLYLGYVAIRCFFSPQLAPFPEAPQASLPLRDLLSLALKGVLPAFFMIAAVLGTLLFGLAAPSEAAALGVCGALLLGYKTLSAQALRETLEKTIEVTSMILFILLAGNMFTGVFLGTGGGQMVEQFIASFELTPFVTLLSVLGLAFAAGFFLDWISILLIIVPVLIPIVAGYGYHKLWVCSLLMLVIQTSYLTPPMAPAIFYFRGIKPDEITTPDIFRGVVPFILLQITAIALLLAMPDISLWLPRYLEEQRMMRM